MNDNVDEELFSNDIFNDVLAAMSRMLALLESDRIEEIADEETMVCDKVKLIFSTKDTELKTSIEKHQKDKKITASKIFTYKKMNNLKY